MNAAANDLSFTPAYPGGVGAPSKIEVSDPSGLEPNQRALGLVYQDPSYGRFWVIEEVSETTESWLKGLASCDHSSGCEGSWSLVTLKDGTTAVDFAGSTNGVLWLYNGVRYDVFGPPATFSTDDALAVANATEAAAASSSSPSSG